MHSGRPGTEEELGMLDSLPSLQCRHTFLPLAQIFWSPSDQKGKEEMGGRNRAWDRWLKDNFVMGVLYMTIYTAVQVNLHGTLSSWTTERGPRREMAKGNVPGGNICSLWAEDDGLCWGVLGWTASCNFYQFKVFMSHTTLVILSTARV